MRDDTDEGEREDDRGKRGSGQQTGEGELNSLSLPSLPSKKSSTYRRNGSLGSRLEKRSGRRVPREREGLNESHRLRPDEECSTTMKARRNEGGEEAWGDGGRGIRRLRE